MSDRTAYDMARENERLRNALIDMLSHWRYLRLRYGDLYGIDWDGLEEKVNAALGESNE